MDSAKENKKRKTLVAFTCIKYIFSIGAMLAAPLASGRPNYMINGLVELLLILLISEFLITFSKVAGIIVNDILLFIYNLQFAVMFFSRIFISTVMIENLNSVRAQSGYYLEYGIALGAVVVFSFLPITELFQKKKNWTKILLISLVVVLGAAEAGLILMGNFVGGPWVKAVQTTKDYISTIQYRKAISQDISGDNGTEKTIDPTSQFYKAEIDDDRKKPAALPERPNVVLILPEGVSQNIIDDDRQIMPYLKKLKQESIFFDRYYNHTFATYRGIIGQLYSGYQLENLDDNHLVSMQSILKENGYHTVIINVEPNNSDFSGYLGRMGFDDVITMFAPWRGASGTISDKDAFQLLFDTMAQESSDTPFFICMYTFGTHESFGSPDEIFGETEDDELDKFYNLDFQFGNFMEQFKDSGLHDNTVVVFSSDHCTYADKDFMTHFPDQQRLHMMLDPIPFMIYYKGVSAETIDAKGRNSLCLAPTLLDLLDISGENMFLGSSLFSDEHTGMLETCTVIDRDLSNTENGDLKSFTEEEIQERLPIITQYYIEKLK